MEISYRLVAAICSRSGCGQAIHVSNGRWLGGTNDRGGLIIQCEKCGNLSYIRVSNPDDASSVKDGGRVVATWDDEVDEIDDVLRAHDLTANNELTDNLLVIPSNDPNNPQFVLEDRAIYRCLVCDCELESPAYDELGNVLDAINNELGSFLIRYVKGGIATPDTIRVTLDVSCACTSHRMVFHRPFTDTDSGVNDPLEFILAGPDNPSMLTDIDGVFSRDDCISIFKKLLLRWRTRHRVVMLVVPFIGLDYPGREENRVDLWNMVLGNTDPSRTLLVTRRATYNGFVEAAKSQGIDISTLAKFNLLTPLVEELGQKGALFKQQSHAKFYAAVGREQTEVLSGSFNIHSGKYAENLLFKTYDTKSFIDRYLVPLGVIYNPEMLKMERDVLAIDLKSGQVSGMTLSREA